MTTAIQAVAMPHTYSSTFYMIVRTSEKGRRGRDVVLNQDSVWRDVAAPTGFHSYLRRGVAVPAETATTQRKKGPVECGGTASRF